MAITVVAVTEQRLSNFTDDEIRDFRESIPVIDRCSGSLSKPLDRESVRRYALDETVDRDATRAAMEANPQLTFDQAKVVVRLGLFAIAVVDSGTPIGLLLVRRTTEGDDVVATIKHWYVRLGDTLSAAPEIVAFAAGRGISVIRGDVFNAKVRARMREYPGVTQSGTRIEYRL